MMVFAVVPAMSQAYWKKALLLGALFVLRYGTYDLTNPATLKTWSLRLSLIDMAWGVSVSAASSAMACALSMRLLRAA